MHVCERLMYLFMSVCTCSNGTGLARSVHLNQTLALGGSVKKIPHPPTPLWTSFRYQSLSLALCLPHLSVFTYPTMKSRRSIDLQCKDRAGLERKIRDLAG